MTEDLRRFVQQAAFDKRTIRQLDGIPLALLNVSDFLEMSPG
jgi:hypothetical protein